MKARLQTSMTQNLVMTPQLRQAIRLLQMSNLELDQEIANAVETNPLLDWLDEAGGADSAAGDRDNNATAASEPTSAESDRGDWEIPGEEPSWGSPGAASGEYDNPAERMAEQETLADHLLWQLHLSQLSPRDRQIGAGLIDALDDDGYLREPLSELMPTLVAGASLDEDEVLAVLHRIQLFDPPGVAARDLAECLAIQLQLLPANTPGRELARSILQGPLERLPRAGIAGLAQELKQPVDQVEQAVQLLRSLDPRPGAGIGEVSSDSYVIPDCVIWRQGQQWRVALSTQSQPKIGIQHGYEQLIRRCNESDASYLRGQLQEARWLLKGLEARGETLLRVVRSLVQHQAGFLEFGEQALRPLTLRELAAELELHESTVSRAIARKHVRTPRGTLPLKAFFASGIDTASGGEASSTAIQAMIRRLIEDEIPRKPLSDAKLAELLKNSGIPVARRTVAKYREAMNIAASHERVRIV